jgi:hypothetical protein
VTTYTLVVSNPPHGEVNLAGAAPALGLAPAEVRMKANYRVPEIWLAAEDDSSMEAAATDLRAAGLHVVVVAGERLSEVPAWSTVKSFAFGEAGLSMRLDDGEVELPYDSQVTAVYCTPRGAVEEARRGGGGGLTEGLRQRSSGIFMARDSLVGFGALGGRGSQSGGEAATVEPAFVDIYAAPAGTPLRLSVAVGKVEFSGLGEQQLPNMIGNLEIFVQEIESRFKGGAVDRRLLDMQARQRPMVGGGSDAPQRKGFSYATQALAKLLESISPDLKDVSQFELSSRLAFLTLSAG